MEILIHLVSLVLFFLGVVIIIYQVLLCIHGFKKADIELENSQSIILRLAAPLLSILVPINAKLKLKRYRTIMKIKFRKAGNRSGLTVDLFLAAKELLVVSFAVLYLLLFKLPTNGVSLIGLFAMISTGWFMPNLILKGHITDRHKKIIRELPYILDLLTVSVEAGLDFMQAVERVVNVMKKGELVRELSLMHKALQMGDSRKTALRQLAYRTEVTDVKTVISALIQADQLGTGIGAALRNVSSQARVQRSQRAEKMAGEATVKLLFPLVLVFIAVMLMVLGPVAMQIFSTLGSH